MTTVLLVDRDAEVRASLIRELAYEGYRVAVAADAQEALRVVESDPPDIVVLDVTLPGLDEEAVIRRVRDSSDAHVVALTTAGPESEGVVGLDADVDDYLVKPFPPAELLARLRSAMHLRGRSDRDHTRYAYADLVVETTKPEVRRGDRLVDLSAREFELLLHLIRQPNQVLTRERLLTAIWGYGAESNVLDVNVGYLRAKLEAGGEPRLVQTVRGVGFSLRSLRQ